MEYRFPVLALAVVAWVVIAMYRMRLGAQARELVHRERLAMIEKGMTPPPEVDPARHNGYGPSLHDHLRHNRSRGPRGGGIMLIAVGLGVGLLISTTSGETGVGLGVGGLLVLVGAGLLAVSLTNERPGDASRPSDHEAVQPPPL